MNINMNINVNISININEYKYIYIYGEEYSDPKLHYISDPDVTRTTSYYYPGAGPEPCAHKANISSSLAAALD